MSASSDEHDDAPSTTTATPAGPTPSAGPIATAAAAPVAFDPPAIEDSSVPMPPGSTTVEPLPPPSAATSADTTNAVPFGARPGDLTLNWRLLLGLAWIAAFFAYSAVWQASVQIGIGTWWLGPRAQPTSMLVRVLPFVLCIAMALCALYNVRHLLRINALGVGLAVLIAVPDFSRSVGLGIAELVVAALVGLVTAAASTGRYRLAPAADAPPATPDEPSVVDPPAVDRH